MLGSEDRTEYRTDPVPVPAPVLREPPVHQGGAQCSHGEGRGPGDALAGAPNPVSSTRDSFLQKLRFGLKSGRWAKVSYGKWVMGLMCEKAPDWERRRPV